MIPPQPPHTSAAYLCHLGHAVLTQKIWLFKHIKYTHCSTGAMCRHTQSLSLSQTHTHKHTLPPPHLTGPLKASRTGHVNIIFNIDLELNRKVKKYSVARAHYDEEG